MPVRAQIRAEHERRRSLPDLPPEPTEVLVGHDFPALRQAVAFDHLSLSGRCPTPHERRHGFASRCIAMGADLVTVSKSLGHADPSITSSVYAHEFEQAKRQAERQAFADRQASGFLADPEAPNLRAV